MEGHPPRERTRPLIVRPDYDLPGMYRMGPLHFDVMLDLVEIRMKDGRGGTRGARDFGSKFPVC